MQQVIVLVALLTLVVGVVRADEPVSEDGTGSICLAPVKDDGDPRGYVSEHFGVRVDDGPWIAVPSDAPRQIPDLALENKHLVSIRDGDETIESFWFRFDTFQSPDLCLWYKPWYRTWSLSNAADGGRDCRCRRAQDEDAG